MHANKRVRIERAANATAPGVISILPSTTTTAVAKIAVTTKGTTTTTSNSTVSTGTDTSAGTPSSATNTTAPGKTETSHDNTPPSSPLPHLPTITVSPPTPTSPRSPSPRSTTPSSPKATAPKAATPQVVFDPASVPAPVESHPASTPLTVASHTASTHSPDVSHSPTLPPPPPIKTYHDTGTNTPRLPASSSHFQAIYGRAPTEADRRPLPHKRFTRAVEPHEVAYGDMYAAPSRKSSSPPKRKASYVDSSVQTTETSPSKEVNSPATTSSTATPTPSSSLKRKATYVDSSFQTEDFRARKKAITGAKVRASLLVKKYSDVASQEGYSIWAEKLDDKVIHSEQVQVKIQFDQHGNVTSGTATECSKVSNVYGEEKKEEKDVPKAIHSLVPAKRERDAAGDAGGLAEPRQTGYPELDHDSTYDSASEEGDEREAKRRKRDDSVGLEEFVVWDPKKEEEKEKVASLRRRVVESMKSAASKVPVNATATSKVPVNTNATSKKRKLDLPAKEKEEEKEEVPAKPLPTQTPTQIQTQSRTDQRESSASAPRVRPPRQEFKPYVPRMMREAHGTTPAAKRSNEDEGHGQRGKRRRLR